MDSRKMSKSATVGKSTENDGRRTRTRSTKEQATQVRSALGIARERQMNSYLPYWALARNKNTQQATGLGADSARDNILTSLAQLAALRLNASRVLISLFNRNSQHVVSEATPTLSLRGNTDPSSPDQDELLWHSISCLPRKQINLCEHAMTAFTVHNEETYVVNDLASDLRFQSHPKVTNHPYNRSYVSVPIKTPDGFIIGNVDVLDDKPRDGINDVMEHLVALRTMREGYRQEKMVTVLGIFMEGKSDLHERLYSQSSLKNETSAPQPNLDSTLKQMHVSDPPGPQQATRSGSESEETQSLFRTHLTNSLKKLDIPPPHIPENDWGIPLSFGQREYRQRLPPAAKVQQESPVLARIHAVLDHASNLIQQALDVEGVMFTDASVCSNGKCSGSGNISQQSLDTRSRSLNRHGDVQHRGMSGKRGHGFDRRNTTHKYKDRSTCQNKSPTSYVLGHSMNAASTPYSDIGDRHCVKISTSVVCDLARRYSRGRIFRVDEDYIGFSSDEDLSDGEEVEKAADTTRLPPKGLAGPDAKYMGDTQQLVEAFPGARSVAFFPLWDFQQTCWFAGCFAWSDSPGRIFTDDEDLTYLAAFCNSIMTEVSRLHLQAADREKADFISSVSHGLRSPLHGILAMVDLLRDTSLNSTQKSLVHTVASWGKSLLGTINHILDHAKINSLLGPDEDDKCSGQPDPSQPSHLDVLLNNVDLSVLVQEVVESLIASQDFLGRDAEALFSPAEQTSNRPFKESDLANKESKQLFTIVDIEYRENWFGFISAGAWRRVILNLFRNALKYTQTGFVRLMLKRVTLDVDGELLPAAQFGVSDFGRGISEDYLSHHLFAPFLQEDSLVPGIGVGLNIVYRIVDSLGGRIGVRSGPGQGTDVNVVLPIKPIERLSPLPLPPADLYRQLQGKTVSIFAHSSQSATLHIKSDIFHAILRNLERMVTEWFGLRVLTSEELEREHAYISIITEYEYRYITAKESTATPDEQLRSRQYGKTTYPLIVLCAHAHSWFNASQPSEEPVIFLQQPVCPKNLAAALSSCLQQSVKTYCGSTEEATSPLTRPPSEGQPVKSKSPGTPRFGDSADIRPSESSPSCDSGQYTIRNGLEDDTVSPLTTDTAVTDERNRTEQMVDSATSHNDHRYEMNKECNILLVEDNSLNLKILETTMKKAGHRYQSATNGVEALQKYKASNFNAIIMDLSMPVMDGIAASREIRRLESTYGMCPVIIIALMALDTPSIKKDAMNSGIDLYLTKPTPIKKLEEILRELASFKGKSFAV
ncbi:sensor histidine kinase/response regulator, putative [Paecilomyces variotii No. 5]|uniref:Sensor histidine kinase/response regulator, putative n=1 Tax=Byssochlamys spectabilis (strain No. 5 / NBRC 109023) TaxID=1356009 RepID=V5FWB6_BYSSN|nr:sensor histidine kinase/response regulator, putative [Paecilomyces variotii No. 5]